MATREWDLGKNEKEKEKDKIDKIDKRREEVRPIEHRRHNRTPDRSPEPGKNFTVSFDINLIFPFFLFISWQKKN